MVKYYEIVYALKNRDGSDFNPCKGIYTANVVADTSDAAVEDLKNGFKALHVNVIGTPKEKTMTDEEYENG